MTITDTKTAPTRFQLVAFDLYKDIHKAIRAELFAVTVSAGQTDPDNRAARSALAGHVRDLQWLLDTHAEHEDAAVQPLIEIHLPLVAEQIAADHHAFDSRVDAFVGLAIEAADSTEPRRLLHNLYIELASFTSTYLAHQEIEERVVMPGLEAAIGIEAVIGVHQQIIGSIPPQDMARSLALMLPAMNLADRVEMLGGMRAEAPAEVFSGVWSLAGSVLDPADHAALAVRLGL